MYKRRETQDQKRARLTRIGAQAARAGGLARAAALTPERRRKIAQRAANARWFG